MDLESPRLPLLVSQRRPSSSSRVLSLDELSDSSEGTSSSFIRKRDVFAWFVIAFQAVALAVLLQSNARQQIASNSSVLSESKVGTPLSINNKLPSYHGDKFLEATSLGESSSVPFYDPPTIYPREAGLVSRVWHSNASPDVNTGLQRGSCWCSGDDYCMCTPALAIDLILTSGPDHIWLVRRKDKGVMALMGGFNEVGETVEEASRRELKEEMNIDLPGQPLTLFGVYSDPKRDSRKHAVSVVFHMDIPPHINPSPGDDVSDAVRMPLSQVEDLDMFIDHKTVLRDFVKMRESQRQQASAETRPKVATPVDGDGEPFKRSVCTLPI
jgi:8-oxo-dGTP diphosphatase